MAITLLIPILVLFVFLWRKVKNKYYEEKVEDINKFTDQMEVDVKEEHTLLKAGYSIEKYKSELKYKLLEKLKKEKPSKSFIFHEIIMQFARTIFSTSPQEQIIWWGITYLFSTVALFFFLPPLWAIFIISYYWFFQFIISIPLIALLKWLISKNLANEFFRDFFLGIVLASTMIFIGVIGNAPLTFIFIALTYRIFTEGQNIQIRRNLDEVIEFAGFGAVFLIFLIYTLFL